MADCKGGCGFFGDPNKEGLCSSCYRKAHPELVTKPAASPSDPRRCKIGACQFGPSKEGYCSVHYRVEILGEKEGDIVKPVSRSIEGAKDDTPGGRLVKACQKGQMDLVRELVASRADVNHDLKESDADNEVAYYTPLAAACFFGQTEVFRFILQQPGVLINKRCYPNTFVVNMACINHREGVLAAILEHHIRTREVDLERRGYGGWTPVESCCNEGVACQDPMVKAMMCRMIRALIAAGARPAASGGNYTFLAEALQEAQKLS